MNLYIIRADLQHIRAESLPDWCTGEKFVSWDKSTQLFYFTEDKEKATQFFSHAESVRVIAIINSSNDMARLKKDDYTVTMDVARIPYQCRVYLAQI